MNGRGYQLLKILLGGRNEKTRIGNEGHKADEHLFSDKFLADFWEDSEYAIESYHSEPPADELIDSIEKELGYKLPSSYIQLMKHGNWS